MDKNEALNELVRMIRPDIPEEKVAGVAAIVGPLAQKAAESHEPGSPEERTETHLKIQEFLDQE